MKKKNIFIVLSIVGIISLVIGVTYAFFNYTRVGTPGSISTGRIYFLSTQSGTLNLTNIFPVSSSNINTNNLDEVTVTITGDTTYTGGEEYEITLVDVHNTINGKEIPIKYIATVENIGTSSNTYWESRGGNEALYTLNQTGQVSEGKQVLVGYIPTGAQGVNGRIKIKAYVDGDRIAISDTIENGAIPVTGYVNGTTTDWIEGRTVLTEEEWNNLQGNNTLRFRVQAESREGIWVQKEGTIASCPNCKFIFSDSNLMYTTWNTKGEEPTILTTGYSEDYRDVIKSTGKNYFLGLITNGSNQVTRAFTCGVYNNVPFCVEGDANGSKYNENLALLQGPNLYNNTCASSAGYAQCGPFNNTTIGAMIMSIGVSLVGPHGGVNCNITNEGVVGCTHGEG